MSLVRAKKFCQKRESRFFVAHIVEGTDADKGQIPGATDGNYHIGNLPENAIVLDSFVQVVSGSDAATSQAATLGTTSGGSEILSAIDMKTPGFDGTFTGRSNTGTGKQVWLGVNATGAGTNVGEYIVVIEYLEYDVTNGEYTSLAEA